MMLGILFINVYKRFIDYILNDYHILSLIIILNLRDQPIHEDVWN